MDPIKQPPHRHHLPASLQINIWEDIQPYFEKLLTQPLDTIEQIKEWIAHKDEYDGAISELSSRRMIHHSRFLEDKLLEAAYFDFINNIQPQREVMNDRLNRYLVTASALSLIETADGYRIMIRGIRNQISLFREENIPLFQKETKLQATYSKLRGAMTIEYNGKELTLQQAAIYLENPDRSIRKEVYELCAHRQSKDITAINDILDQLIEIRTQIAHHADCKDYVEYKYRAYGRFDYGQQEVMQFHEGIKQVVTPRYLAQLEKRKQSLGIDTLKPYDLQVDPHGRASVKVFSSETEAIDRTIHCLSQMDHFFGEALEQMKSAGQFDLEARKGKRSGAFLAWELNETKIPYMFGNLVGTIRDLTTMIHESGHAIHGTFMHRDLPLNVFHEVPMEVAEIGSMALELLSMDHRHVYNLDTESIAYAKNKHLEDIIEIFPWISCIDQFQHRLYTHPGHTHTQRGEAWKEIFWAYKGAEVDFQGYEDSFLRMWQKQLHIFTVPFYYIEYGIAQLGALALWKQYKSDPIQAIQNYKNILTLGYTKTMPEIFSAGNIAFRFDSEYIHDIVNF